MSSFLKWVGGKKQILKKMINYFPKNINNYIEPFLGGGSVFFHVKTLVEKNKIQMTGKFYLSDINYWLINCYKVIQVEPKKLIEELQVLKTTYNNLPYIKNLVKRKTKIPTKEESERNKEEFYYYMRNQYNMLKKTKTYNVSLAALFIFLNKTCFRGLYRENKNGFFSTPFGHYKNLNFFDKENIYNVHNLLKDVVLECNDYKKIKSEENDFIYLDPPYYSTFTNYNKNKFEKQQQINLLNFCDSLKCKFVQSNSNTEFIKRNYSKYKIIPIDSKNYINAKNTSKIQKEILIIK